MLCCDYVRASPIEAIYVKIIIIMGFKASIPMHYQIPFGTVGIGKTPLNRERDDQPRGAICMLIGRDLSSQRSLKVLVLSTQSVIHVSSSTAIPLDHTVIQSSDEIALNDAEDEENEDPLAEEPSFAHTHGSGRASGPRRRSARRGAHPSTTSTTCTRSPTHRTTGKLITYCACSRSRGSSGSR